ncbi:hypothetical protein [Xenorhabdus lircayensis]|uniref:Uncharacterized protein n=1 Tax=Xenorhabdus lircayensis TaxID=2763499 RepID=A0ABS0U0J7_9GAMM|nr:hypothetical protein [Xenorhabdus lircayensis]MBI6547392.1 hypothetical protein [Xenorhabdus lircayensis]
MTAKNTVYKDPELHKRAVSRFHELHAAIFGEISSILKKAKLLPLIELRKHNPSFTEIAEELIKYRDLAQKVAAWLDIEEDQFSAYVDEYIALTRELAKAIDDDNPEALCGAIAALDEKPYI